MATYVISDIHGCFDEFQSMLQMIHFSEDDQMILGGDYIDRGKQSYEMLQWILNCPDHVLLLKGNHDAEYAECISIMASFGRALGLDADSAEDTSILYLAMEEMLQIKESYFDHYRTIKNLIMDRNVRLSELEAFAVCINQMPFYYKIMVNGRKCVVVHAGYREKPGSRKEEEEQFFMYARKEAYVTGGIRHGIIIAGHTPTILKNQFVFNKGKVFCYHNKDNDCIFYDIDCGCAYRERYLDARLACIRLEDKHIFYV